MTQSRKFVSFISRNLFDLSQEIYLISKKSPIYVEVGKKEIEITFPDNQLLKIAVRKLSPF